MHCIFAIFQIPVIPYETSEYLSNYSPFFSCLLNPSIIINNGDDVGNNNNNNNDNDNHHHHLIHH